MTPNGRGTATTRSAAEKTTELLKKKIQMHFPVWNSNLDQPINGPMANGRGMNQMKATSKAWFLELKIFR